MQGINLVVNDHQEHIAVIIDLKQPCRVGKRLFVCPPFIPGIGGQL